MPRWFDREEQQFEQELERGEITQAQFNAAIREFRAELREAAASNTERPAMFVGRLKARQSINGTWYVDDANRRVVKTVLTQIEAERLAGQK